MSQLKRQQKEKIKKKKENKMIKSMTGYGKSNLLIDLREYQIEVRTVNHKYIDTSIKIPKVISYLEDDVRKTVCSKIKRGKVDVSISFDDYSKEDNDIKINTDIAKMYIESFKKLAQEENLSSNIEVSDIVRLPDVLIIKNKLDEEQIKKELMQVLEEAVEQVIQMRENEGKKISEDIKSKISQIEAKTEEILELSTGLIQEYEPLVYRMFNFTSNYKTPINFTFDAMDSAKVALNRLREGYILHMQGEEEIDDTQIEEYKNKFLEAINDNLNMPVAMSVIWDVVKNSRKSKKLGKLLLKFDEVLGFDLKNYQKEEKEISQEIMDLVDLRKKARADKNWAESDRIRDLILEKGYLVKDTKEGMEITPKQ